MCDNPKKEHKVLCTACGDEFSLSALPEGITCGNGHFYCNVIDEDGEGKCAETFLGSLLMGNDSAMRARCIEMGQGSLAIKCADCCAPFELDKVFDCLPEAAQGEWATMNAIGTLDEKKEVAITCIAANCNKPVICPMVNGKLEYIVVTCLYCMTKGDPCRFCATCCRAITRDDEKTHITECWSLLALKQDIEDALNLGMNMQCPNPDCQRRARKDANCTHIQCPFCSVKYCFLCQLTESEVDKGGHQGMLGHNLEWKSNIKRCPTYLQHELHSYDSKIPDAELGVANWFHRQRSLHYLQTVFSRHSSQDVQRLVKLMPSVLNGFDIQEILQFQLHPVLKRGTWWRPPE